MEIGFVKQSLNNEIIRLKQPFLQAKVQTINNLTKKSKLFKIKYQNHDTKEKFQSKAEQMLNEVFIIKKLKPRDLVEFVLRNNENIQHFLNSPIATKEKAFSRLVTHKSLVEKVVHIKEKFLNMPVDMLLAPGKRQLLKEVKPRKSDVTHLKKKKKSNNAAGKRNDWIVTSIPDSDTEKVIDELRTARKEIKAKKNISTNSLDIKIDELASLVDGYNPTWKETIERSGETDKMLTTKKVTPIKRTKKIVERKLKRKISVTEADTIPEPSGVDSFFVTNNGDRYETLVEKRVQEPVSPSAHVRGNRKMRRAAIFGRPVPYQHKKSNNIPSKTFTKPDKLLKPRAKMSVLMKKHYNSKSDIKDNTNEDIESLHPSWQAKKLQSSITEFKGKKMTFDDN